jgi:UDP-N-acetylglucosamine 4,6-dehydratase/5-epimerase
MHNKKMLIIGGTGSLGGELTARLLKTNQVYLFSRDESKHWALQIEHNSHPNLHFIIGDIGDKNKINETLIRHNFEIIILAAAMKHIDRCEYSINECMNTNLLGTKNVLDGIELFREKLGKLEGVCFVSTDKACSPVNVYGMTKALSEAMMVEKSRYLSGIKLVTVRYGNVLNSRGSIIPMLHKIGKNKNIKEFTLTHDDMTRLVMTLGESVDLILYALAEGKTGEIIVPELRGCYIRHLLDIFSDIYNKSVILGKMRHGEKLSESLINETQAVRTEKRGKYTHILPSYKSGQKGNHREYNSQMELMSRQELLGYLTRLKLL